MDGLMPDWRRTLDRLLDPAARRAPSSTGTIDEKLSHQNLEPSR